MSIHPIQGFKNLSKAQKAAIIGGAAVAALTVAAGIKGNHTTYGWTGNIPKKVIEGYKCFGKAIKNLYNDKDLIAEGILIRGKRILKTGAKKVCNIAGTVAGKVSEGAKAAWSKVSSIFKKGE